MPYDTNGEWYAASVTPKGEGRKKKSAAPKETAKSPPKDETVKESVKDRNNRNRGFGKSVERTVAKLTGGDRVPASGAIKTSAWNLVGDVQVKDNTKKIIALIECKGTSGITPSGDKTFALKKSVLDQATKEADLVGALGVVYIHWKNANYVEDDYVVMSSRNFLMLLEMVKSTGVEIDERA